MNRFQLRIAFYGLIFLTQCLASCSSEPRRIASYPSDGWGSSGTGLAHPPGELVYHAYLELSVNDVEMAAKRVEQLAYDYGGYVSSSHFWVQDERTYATLAVEVPTRNFEGLRERLIRLGSLESERTLGEWLQDDPPGWDCYSQIILNLKPAGFTWPKVELPKWRPLRTLERAFGVSLSIFGFLLDVLIWVVVVGGPFLLLGWGLKKLIPRIRR